jgi:hypothetical protein
MRWGSLHVHYLFGDAVRFPFAAIDVRRLSDCAKSSGLERDPAEIAVEARQTVRDARRGGGAQVGALGLRRPGGSH